MASVSVMISEELNKLPGDAYFKKYIRVRPTKSDLDKYTKDYPEEANTVSNFRLMHKGTRAKVNHIQLANFNRREIYMLRDKIAWDYFSKKQLADGLIDIKFLPYIDWTVISKLKCLTVDAIAIYKEKLDFDLIFKPVLTDKIVYDFADNVNWDHASEIKLQDETLEKNKDKVLWDKYLLYNQLTETQLIKYSGKLDWKIVSATQNFSMKFIHQNTGKLDWKILYNRQKYAHMFDENTNIKNINLINWDIFAIKPSVPDQFILDNFEKYLSSIPFSGCANHNDFIQFLRQIDLKYQNEPYEIKRKKLLDFTKKTVERVESFKKKVFIKFYGIKLIDIKQDYAIFSADDRFHYDQRTKSNQWCNQFIFTNDNDLYAISNKNVRLFQIKPKKIPLKYLEFLALIIDNANDAIIYTKSIVEGVVIKEKVNEYEAYKIFEKWIIDYTSWGNDPTFKLFVSLNF